MAKTKKPFVVTSRMTEADLPPAKWDEKSLIGTPEDLASAMTTGRPSMTFADCPTCGTEKVNNRCEVCGHQEHDE